MKLDAHTVEEYFEKVPEDRQLAMQEMREFIITHAPDVTEIFKYNLPFYPIQDEPFISLASQKHHISFYLNEPELIEEFRPKLGKVDVAKNCVRIRNYDNLDKQAFIDLIERAYKKRMIELG